MTASVFFCRINRFLETFTLFILSYFLVPLPNAISKADSLVETRLRRTRAQLGSISLTASPATHAPVLHYLCAPYLPCHFIYLVKLACLPFSSWLFTALYFVCQCQSTRAFIPVSAPSWLFPPCKRAVDALKLWLFAENVVRPLPAYLSTWHSLLYSLYLHCIVQILKLACHTEHVARECSFSCIFCVLCLLVLYGTTFSLSRSSSLSLGTVLRYHRWRSRIWRE